MNPEVSQLLDVLRDERAHVRTLEVGFQVRLSAEQLDAAALLNLEYQNVLWGVTDDAANTDLQDDEREIIERTLTGEGNGTTSPALDALEIGCGSGRVTAHLAQRVRYLYAMDFAPEVMARVRKHPSLAVAKNVTYALADFSHELDFGTRFDRIFLIENLLGMNPSPHVRRAIITNTFRHLKNGGQAIFGFRVRNDVPEGELIYQAMPYGGLFGLAVNWSVGAMEAELRAVCPALRVDVVHEGRARPAGGVMTHLVVTPHIS